MLGYDTSLCMGCHLPLRYLDGKEIDRLAEWVWSSFHPGKKIDSMTLYL